MRSKVSTILEVAGLAAVAAAAWSVSIAAGLVATGGALLLVGWSLER